MLARSNLRLIPLLKIGRERFCWVACYENGISIIDLDGETKCSFIAIVVDVEHEIRFLISFYWLPAGEIEYLELEFLLLLGDSNNTEACSRPRMIWPPC